MVKHAEASHGFFAQDSELHFILQVGHNALGGGKITDQGSVLVDKAIKSKEIFTHDCWQGLEPDAKKNTLHLIGLLSDGGVHARLDQLIPIMEGVGR